MMLMGYTVICAPCARGGGPGNYRIKEVDEPAPRVCGVGPMHYPGITERL